MQPFNNSIKKERKKKKKTPQDVLLGRHKKGQFGGLQKNGQRKGVTSTGGQSQGRQPTAASSQRDGMKTSPKKNRKTKGRTRGTIKIIGLSNSIAARVCRREVTSSPREPFRSEKVLPHD